MPPRTGESEPAAPPLAPSALAELRKSEARYRVLAEATNTAVWAADDELRALQDSPSWRTLTGQHADEMLGHGWFTAIHPEERAEARSVFLEAVRRGLPFAVEHRLRRAEGSYGTFLFRCVPVPTAERTAPPGRVAEWICTCVDVTAVRAAERQRDILTRESAAAVERLQRLQWTTAALSEAATVDEVAAVVLAGAKRLPGVVRGGLALLSAAKRELRFVALDDQPVERTGALPWCGIDATADLPLAAVVRSGAPLYFPDMDAFGARFPHLLSRQLDYDTHAFATLPLIAGEDVLGGLMLQFSSERSFTETEQAFLGALAAQAAQALRRAFDYEEQRGLAEMLQRSLLPDSLPELPGLALGARYQAAGQGVDVGGDWFDVVPLDSGAVVVALGDVMGKGVAAATVMGQVRAALRSYALLDPEPRVVLERLDRMVTTLGAPEQIVTLAYVLVSADRKEIGLGLAGHIPPAVVTPLDRPAFLDLEPGPPLGVGAGEREAVRMPFEPGSVVVLCSDGLVESRGRPIGTGLEELRRSLEELDAPNRDPRELCTRLIQTLAPSAPEDDIAVLALASVSGKRLKTATLSLPADTTAPRTARRFLMRRLLSWRVEPELREPAKLCLSELVTNAVIHSRTAPRVALQLDEHRLLVLVNDEGHHGAVRRQDAKPDDDHGRGLALVDALATSWDVERDATGTTVWFELARPR